ncbi:MAG: M28 family peptidase [Gemmatimonadaceae bacterium]|nr:M28 family peptidase [Gemmatimonadaceae bacterium]
MTTRLLLTAALLPALAHAQRPAAPMPGFATTRIEAQRALEARAITIPHGDSARRLARALAREPHIAGTAAQERTRDFVHAQLRALGLAVETRSYRVYLPHATGARLWRLSPDSAELPLEEPAIDGDRHSAMVQYPTVNGYSAGGDVSGEVVYVNYGLIEDYAQLDSIGVSVRGRLVVARYGRSFRGIKAREAEKRGAVGLLIYSDPSDDGFVRGDVYPEGAMRPPRGVQRGSVYNGAGDPSTPGWPATTSARRLPPDSMTVPRIPVVPIGYGTAQQLLASVRGANVPQAWQGGLPFRYHAGPGPVRARLQVTLDTIPYKTIHNTLATLRGAEHPDEFIVIGGHRDAWNAGSVDNVSGVTSILEAARAITGALGGARPARTLVFATWDAEEWGLVGSSEYVEDDSLRLQHGAVAYVNLDVSASGLDFGAGGSPSLRALTRDIAKGVDDPAGRGSVYARWRSRSGVKEGDEPAMGDPGGGSDFAGFYNHLGIPHADWGFGGPGGIYHSAYDTPAWQERFGDTNYVAHAAAARLAAAWLLRIANADVVPFDYVEFGETMSVASAELALRALRMPGAARARADFAPLHDAWRDFIARAGSFQRVRDSVLAAGGVARPRLVRANAALRDVERRLTRPTGLVSRPWYRSLIYAADVDNGYATMVLPGIGEALRARDERRTAAEIADLATRVASAAAALDTARLALEGR